ncbi:MAG TPA: molybdate ABC transporter substrate-binding protein, partial [Longimicrobiales bacterium]|nr:molybdate ABC transporter substrate-binding protein [Longimicrobiales bacterium]
LAGCGGDGEEAGAGVLLVLAASDLAFAFDELVPLYEARTGDSVSVVLGSTGNLAAQLRHGAPGDLFFSANEAFLDGLIDAGRIEPTSRSLYAIGRVAVVVPHGRQTPAGPEAIEDPALRVIAIANPDHAPYGVAAREVLEGLGLWAAVEPRLVLGENIAHTLQFVRTGNADLGIVALSLLRGAPGEPLPHVLLDGALHQPLRQVAGVVTASRRADRARAFLDFVLSPEGRDVLARYGFELPETSFPEAP